MTDTHLSVLPGVDVPRSELEFSAVRAAGPGGQHVNKTSTAVELRFDSSRSVALDEEQRERIRNYADRRISRSGIIVIKAQGLRSQARNRRAAEERLCDLLKAALARRPRRIPTKPSAAQQEKRRQDKAHRSRVKDLRKPVDD